MRATKRRPVGPERGRSAAHLNEFRTRLQSTVHEMITGVEALEERVDRRFSPPVLINDSAAQLGDHPPFADGTKASLVVTSPPYPGIHMLYHRWQVDGRRETAAPYWLAECNDGHGATFYNFAYRSEAAADTYFAESLKTLSAIRRVMRDGAKFVQLIAFANPKRHLPRYLANMEKAGFLRSAPDTAAFGAAFPAVVGTLSI